MRRIILILLLLLSPLSAVQGQTKSKKVRKLERERLQMLKNIESTDRKLKAVKKDTHAQQKHLELVRRQATQRKEMVKLLGSEISALEQDIDSLAIQIRSLHAHEQELLEQYKRSVRAIVRGTRAEQQLLFIFSASSLQEGVQRQRFLSRYASSSRRSAEQLSRTRNLIRFKHRELNAAHESKVQLQAQREQERRRLETEADQRTAQVASLKNQQTKLAQTLERQQIKAQQLERKIEQQIAHEIAQAEKARQERVRRRAEASKRAERRRAEEMQSKKDYNEPTRVDKEGEGNSSPHLEDMDVADAQEIKLSGGFARNKGRLPMPIRGRYQLVRRFGLQQHETHSRVKISSGGIDVKPVSDRRVYAVFDGVVGSIFVTPGYGSSLIIRHGDYRTTYTNLSAINVRKGQQVKAGSVIGTISSEGVGERAGALHFQLWYGRTKQDPLRWLKK